MKNILTTLQRAGMLLGVVAIPIFFSGCEKDEGPDTQSPQITITSPTSATFLKGEVSIQANVTDNRGIRGVNIMIDGVFFKKVTSSTVDEKWNSKTVSDGQHTIELVAIDMEGNEQSASIEVNVYNYFISIVVPEYYGYWMDETYYVTKGDGTFIGLETVTTNNDTLRFETPDDFDPSQKFVLTKFYTVSGTGSVLKTFTDISAGVYHLKSNLYQILVGRANITVNNLPQNGNVWIRGGGEGANLFAATSNGDESATFQVDLIDNTADVFVGTDYMTNELLKYKVVNGVGLNDDVELDYNEFADYDVIERTLPDNSALNFNFTAIKAVTSAGSEWGIDVSFHFNMDTPEKVQYSLPGEAFDDYVFTTVLATNEQVYVHTKRGAEVPNDFPPLNANLTSFTYEDATMSLQTSTTTDYKYVQGYYLADNDHSHDWTVFMPGTSSNTVKLSIPQELKDKFQAPNADQFEFVNVNFSAIEGINGYSDYIDFVFSDDGLMDVATEVVDVIKTISTSGRKKPGSITTDKTGMLNWVDERIRRGY